MAKKDFKNNADKKQKRPGYNGRDHDVDPEIVYQSPEIENIQKTSKPYVLMGQGEFARSDARKYVDALAKEIGLNPELCVVLPPLKSLDRVFEKATERYNGETNNIRDILRFRILFKTPEDILRFRELFKKGFENQKFHKDWANKNKNSVVVTEIEDRFLHPHEERGVIGLNMNAGIAMGKSQELHIFEIQLMHEDMQMTDYITHKMFEESRSIKAKAKAEKRDLTPAEKVTVHNNDVATKRFYEFDAYKLDLLKLRSKPPAYGWRPGQDPDSNLLPEI